MAKGESIVISDLEPITGSVFDDRATAALERIATALEQLVLERIPGPAPVQPPYVTNVPPPEAAMPTASIPGAPVVMGPPPRPQRPPDDPQHPPTQPCASHGWTWKWVPPGTSKKTGNPYSGFWACNVRGCDQRP